MDSERVHWLSVLASFRGYERALLPELARRAESYAKLPAALRARLPAAAGAARDGALRTAASANQLVLDALVAAAEDGGIATDEAEEDGAADGAAAEAAAVAAAAARPTHISKARSTLSQLARDWSEEGAAERAACYGPVLAELAARLPPPARVLVPGCGAGRLVLDACLAGYAAQGSEFSLQMLFASNLMLNASEAPRAWTIHPYIHDSCNHVSAEDMLRPVRVPDVVAAAALAAGGGVCADMSMTSGEFCAVYSAPAQRGAFDAALCVFFLDTAPVLHEYLDTLRHALRPGGLLIALGPLLYHWAAGAADEEDERFARSLELPWEDVRFAVEASGFRILKEAPRLRQTYAGNARALQHTVYDCMLMVAERV